MFVLVKFYQLHVAYIRETSAGEVIHTMYSHNLTLLWSSLLALCLFSSDLSKPLHCFSVNGAKHSNHGES